MNLRRIFALVPDCHVAGWRYADVWRRHFYNGLQQAGVSVIIPKNVDFGWARPVQAFDLSRSAGTRAQVSETLLSQILTAEGGPPQAVISCCFSCDIELNLVDLVRAAGIPWINFFCDSLYAFDWVSALAARTSLNWFVESAAEERYRSLGVPYLRAPYPLNPTALPDASCDTPSRGLLFIGTAYRRRIQSAALLRLAGADLHVRGWGWRETLEPKTNHSRVPTSFFKRVTRAVVRQLLNARVGEYLDDDTLLKELRRSTVVLGLNEGGVGPDAPSYLKFRDLEFPGMGCCYLTQYHSDLTDIYSIGSEIMTFRTPWEAGRLAKDLARHPAKCREIGRRARARILTEHTWSVRLLLLESFL